jgi:hypothetical protein
VKLAAFLPGTGYNLSMAVSGLVLIPIGFCSVIAMPSDDLMRSRIVIGTIKVSGLVNIVAAAARCSNLNNKFVRIDQRGEEDKYHI